MVFDGQNYLKDKAKVANKALKIYCSDSVSPLLSESMNYSLFAGGKRLRPILSLATWDLLTNKTENYNRILPFSCALEMIHTYSLIHDDLPAMDNDDLRRGKPTNHKVYGDAIAILAGDALLTDSFTVLSKLDESFSPEKVLQVIKLVAMNSGSSGMVGGQVLDILNDGRSEIDESSLEQIYACKTGALITASVVGPAILIGNDEDKEILTQYGKSLGLAFQIVDDILGVTATQEDLGKSPNKDRMNNKMTYIELLGPKGAREKAKLEVERAKESLVTYGELAEPFIWLADYVLTRFC